MAMLSGRLLSKASIFMVATICLVAVGCGGPEVFNVQGRVTFNDGEPVRTGRIEYNAVEGPHRAMGEIDDSGNFRLMTADGVYGLPAGQYEVIVVQLVITEDLSLEEHDHGRPVPRKYADYSTSGLKAVISPANSIEQEIVVESD